MPTDFSVIINMLDNASTFELYRLNVAIDRMLSDPKRILAIKQHLRIGQEIEYFDSVSNAPVKAHLLECNKTRVLVQNLSDGKRWKLPYHWLNIDAVDTTIQSNQKKGLQRHEIAVGERLGFVSRRDNVERYGTVLRLNPKTVTLDCKTTHWKVPYQMLFKVIDGEANNGETAVAWISGELS